jgi:hypothetical protein
MTVVADKSILLKVADEIEADENYSGLHWWDTITQCGCAMVRTVAAAGGVVRQNPTAERNVLFSLDTPTGAYTDVDSCHLESAMTYITGVSDSVWGEFVSFSCNADRFWTAKALREIVETDDFKQTHEEFRAASWKPAEGEDE